jgi:hypothetical protein
VTQIILGKIIAGGLLKVVRFHEETVYQPEVIESVAPETGWKWDHRYALICGAAVLLGVLLWGTLLLLLLAPIYQKTGAWWPLILASIGIAILTFFFQFWLGRYFLLNGLNQLVERTLAAVPEKIALPKESLRKVSGLEGAKIAQAFNSLMTLVRAENGHNPPTFATFARDAFWIVTTPLLTSSGWSARHS